MSTPRSQKPSAVAVMATFDGAGDVEGREVVTGGGVGDVDRFAIDGDGEGGGTQFRRDGNGLDAGRGWGGLRKHEEHQQRCAMTEQKAKPLQ